MGEFHISYLLQNDGWLPVGVQTTNDIYSLLNVLLCIIAEYFYELCRILASPWVALPEKLILLINPGYLLTLLLGLPWQ